MIFLIGVALAWEPTLPAAPTPSPQDCSAAIDLIAGQPLPPGLLDAQGKVRCTSVVAPPSQIKHLLLIEQWALQTEARLPQWELEKLSLAQEKDFYKQERDRLLNHKPPWYERPGAQRLLGRLETAAAVVLVGGLIIGLEAASNAVEK